MGFKAKIKAARRTLAPQRASIKRIGSTNRGGRGENAFKRAVRSLASAS